MAHTPCFRSEAGAAGKDTRGMIRQHQFDKVELVHIVRAGGFIRGARRADGPRGRSVEAAGAAVSHGCAVRAAISASRSAKTYDLEVWLPGQDRYREISSCSNCETFQARRMQARWRNPDNWKARAAAHAERFGRRGRPRAGRRARELPERGRLGHRAGRVAGLHGRTGADSRL